MPYVQGKEIMSDSMDVVILKYKLARLADMVYDIRKCWVPNKNLEKMIPHLEKAMGWLKKELKAYEKKIAYDRRKRK